METRVEVGCPVRTALKGQLFSSLVRQVQVSKVSSPKYRWKRNDASADGSPLHIVSQRFGKLVRAVAICKYSFNDVSSMQSIYYGLYPKGSRGKTMSLSPPMYV